MVLPCLLCDKPAVSKEHIFPAAFGGRREERGIYCTDHNSRLGAHVNALLAQLDVVNAELGIRGDRRDDVRPAMVLGPDGETYALAEGRIEVLPPRDIDANYEGFDGPRDTRFPSQAAADRWANKQRKNGYKVKAKPVGPPAIDLNIEPFHAARHFGEPPFMRALLYLGVTSLARHYPSIARAEGLAAARAELLRKGDLEVAVSWQPPRVIEQLGPNPYNLGHTIVVAIDKDSGLTSALISLWGVVHFGMEFGIAEVGATERTVAFIDPFAEFPFDDRQERKQAGERLVLANRDDGIAYLRSFISGAEPNPFEELFAFAAERQLAQAVESVYVALDAARSFRPAARDDAIVAAIGGQRQRLLNLLVRAVRLAQTKRELPHIDEIAAVLLKKDAGRTQGLSRETDALLRIVSFAVIRQLRGHVLAGTLTRDAVRGFLGGQEGNQIAGEAVARVLLSAYGIR